MITDRATAKPLCVLDTKYKPGGRTLPSDLQQIVAYAVAKGCTHGILCYPQEDPDRASSWSIGGIEVRRLAFELGGDLELGGAAFLARLLGVLG